MNSVIWLSKDILTHVCISLFRSLTLQPSLSLLSLLSKPNQKFDILVLSLKYILISCDFALFVNKSHNYKIDLAAGR